MKNVLITGATGFIGVNLVAYLENFHFCVDKLSLRQGFDEKILKNSSSIVHLAGKAHAIKQVSDPNQYYKINYELTKNLFDAFLKSEANKFIFISSVKATADQVKDVLMESDFPNPQTHYGKSKLMAEKYIQNQPLPVGKSFYILRPCMIHGPNNKGNLNLLYKIISKGLPWPLGVFKNNRSFLSVENFCFIIKELIDREDIPSGVYNVADDNGLSTNELIHLISNSLNKTPKIWNIPSKIILEIAKIGDFLRLPINSERLNKLTENYLVSNQKIVEAIGKPLPIQGRDGLIKTFESFKTSK